MHFPKLTPLQSRFAASFAASCLLLLLCFFSFSNPHFAYAAEVASIIPTDHNHPLVSHLRSIEEELRLQDDHPFDGQDQRYEPDFEGLGKSIVGRQEPEVVDLDNNTPGNKSIGLGDQQFWRFPQTALEGPQTFATPKLPPSPGKRSAEEDKEEIRGDVEALDLRKRQNTVRTLYLTLNVCDQPSPGDNQLPGPAPQLNVYVSQGSSNQRPGAGQPDQTPLQMVSGAGNLTISASDDVFIGVHAPMNGGFQGNYNYELTASIDAPYAFFQDLKELYLVDSDSSSAFFVSTNLTAWNSNNNTIQQWLKTPAPFGLFVHPSSDAAFSGISRSYCGLRNHAQIQNNLPGVNSTVDLSKPSVNASISKDIGGLLKQKNYLTGLNSSTNYTAIMAIGSNFTTPGSGPGVNGGGTVWQSISFTTKSGMICQSFLLPPFLLTLLSPISMLIPYHQTEIAKSPATFLFAPPSTTPYQPTPLAFPLLKPWAPGTTPKPKSTSSSSTTPSTKFHATLPTQPATPSLSLAKTVQTHIKPGFAP